MSERKFSIQKKIEETVLKIVEQDMYELYFQPIWNKNKKCYDKCEVLTRLNDYTYREIELKNFFEILKKRKLCSRFDLQIIKKVWRSKISWGKLN